MIRSAHAASTGVDWGGRCEYSWGQLGQFHRRRKWHQVAVYPRGYCSRHVQPASTLDYLTLCRSSPTSLSHPFPFRNCQPPSRWNRRWPTKCSSLSGPVANGLRQVYVRNRPNWPRLSYQDTNRVTVEVPLKAEAGVELAWTVIFQKSQMHEGVGPCESTDRLWTVFFSV